MSAPIDSSRVPLGERLAWTPAQAAQVYSLDYRGLLHAIAPATWTRSARRTVTECPAG